MMHTTTRPDQPLTVSRTIAFVSAASLLSLAISTPLAGQSILAQWDANDRSSSSAFLAPSSGSNAASGLAAGYGQSNPPIPFASVLVTGSPVDSGLATVDGLRNLSYVVNPPLTSAANTSVGLSFKVSTMGMSAGEAVQVSWSQAVGWRSSRYWQILATTDGSTWSLVPTGTGSSTSISANGFTGTSPFTPITGTASVTVSDTGLIDFRTLDQNLLTPASTTTAPIDPFDAAFVNGISFTFPTGLGFENNPDFGFAIVGAWDPAVVSAVDGTTGLVSSFFGTDSSDTVNGYNRSLGSGGSMRLDMVTVAAVPEPSTYAWLAGLTSLGLVILRRRRK